MAARQDQGLVFTLIAFVILFIIAFVAAYVGWKSYSDSETHVAELQNQLELRRNGGRHQEAGRQRAAARTMDRRRRSSTTSKTLKRRVKEDMTKYGANFGEDRQSYRNIVEYLAKENESISSREVGGQGPIQGDQGPAAGGRGRKGKAGRPVRGADEGGRGRCRDRNARSSKKDRESLEAKKQELLRQSRQARGPSTKSSWPTINTQLKDLTEKLTKSEQAKDNLLAEVSKSAESFEVPDGRISWVNQNGTVWINLGSADALRRQITFSVFDADQSGSRQDRAEGQHRSHQDSRRSHGRGPRHRATIRAIRSSPATRSTARSGIAASKLRFALMGIIDLDGDGHNDMKLARDLIELNGGVVDAYVADDGKIEGSITVNTRYLVRGDHPEAANQAALQVAWDKMSTDAKTNGVEVITLDKFLNQIGYAPDDRTVQLGAGARGVDFPPLPATGSAVDPRRSADVPPAHAKPHGPIAQVDPLVAVVEIS